MENKNSNGQIFGGAADLNSIFNEINVAISSYSVTKKHNGLGALSVYRSDIAYDYYIEVFAMYDNSGAFIDFLYEIRDDIFNDKLCFQSASLPEALRWVFMRIELWDAINDWFNENPEASSTITSIQINDDMSIYLMVDDSIPFESGANMFPDALDDFFEDLKYEVGTYLEGQSPDNGGDPTFADGNYFLAEKWGLENDFPYEYFTGEDQVVTA